MREYLVIIWNDNVKIQDKQFIYAMDIKGAIDDALSLYDVKDVQLKKIRCTAVRETKI